MKGEVVVDTAPLIDYLCNEGVVDKIQKEIINNPDVTNVIVSPITLAEIFYVLCRAKGEEFATEKTDIIKNAAKIELEFKIRDIAGKYKCERAISLADCYVLATAKINSTIAVFKKEQEIVDELNKKPFDVNIKLY
ncbi:MAG: PIN domain-containing protein [Candidatus Helarchaeota archaeon]